MQKRGLLRLKASDDRLSLISDALTVESETTGDKWCLVRPLKDGSILIPNFALDEGILGDRAVASIEPKSKYTFSGTLRPYQEEPVAAVSEKLSKPGSGVMLQADCGTGKTIMSLAIAAATARNVIVLVDQLDIAEQWAGQIKAFIPDAPVTVMGGGNACHNEVMDGFRIVVAQTLYRKDWIDTPMSCDLLIVDEAHAFAAPRFYDAIANINFSCSIGLTATPDRKDGLERVFQWSLGTEVVRVKGKAMTAKVVMALSDNFCDKEVATSYSMLFCNVHHKMTWMKNCTQCNLFAKYPDCGGGLPTDPFGDVAWHNSKRTNTTGMVKAACSQRYLSWIAKQAKTIHKTGRQAMIFVQFLDVIDQLKDDLAWLVPETDVGVFIGKANTSASKKRKQELLKPLTICTYSVADKALDVPHKDTAIFVTPKSDVRQAKGRIERVVEGKRQPLILDPVHANIPLLQGMSFKRRRIYKDSGCDIITKHV